MSSTAGQSDEFHIRKASHDDWRWLADRILDVHLEVAPKGDKAAMARQVDATIEAVRHPKSSPLGHIRGEKAPKSDAFIAETLDGTKAGMIWLTEQILPAQGGRVAWVLEIYTVPEFRRKGVAKLLMKRAEEWAREHGIPKILLNVHVSNAAARAFYRSIGYREDTIWMSKGA